MVAQRYPYAGQPNAGVTLGLMCLDNNTTQWLDYAQSEDDYLARVDWLGSSLCVQVQARDQRELRLQRWHMEQNLWQPLLTEQSDTWVELHDNFTPLGDSAFLWTSEANGLSQLLRCDIADTGLSKTNLTLKGHVNQIVNANDDWVWYLGWHDNPTEQQLYRVAANGNQAPMQLTTQPGWHQVNVNSSGDILLDELSSEEQPPRLQIIAGDRGSPTLIAGATLDATPYSEFAAQHCASTLGQLQAADGQTLHYRLTKPAIADDVQVPLVVHVYGGPGVQRVRQEWPPLVNQLFAQAGYGVLQLDNRGSSNRGRAFSAPIHRRLGKVEVADQLVGAKFAQSLPWVDAKRIGVFGHSYGGYMTFMCLCQAPEVFMAGAAVAPVADWSLYDTHYPSVI